MHTAVASFWRTVLALSLSALLVACVGNPPAPPAEIAQKIEAANTRTDHEALASYYVKEAATARAVADKHRKMAKSYQGVPQRGGPTMSTHCTSIAQWQESIASGYESMATAHRDMAQLAKP